ncbi:MAG: PIG-L family deacetylase [Chitinophagales bacterium]|jgi:LmbE family N-acetylglucosaminyl deacetylase|nr:PIG-L family deacetylase [Chitinophagales bacterium]
MKKSLFIICFLSALRISFAQQVEWNSSRILLEIQKLNTTGSVLYIAAHPDDENTRMITYLANEKKVRTGYLSLTRGDGGQNLVGDEQGAYLGLIRTQELMAARRTDGGEQFFTRAVDFGYSKSATETFTKWPHDSILSDVVWVIRNFRPDIIIMRFPPDERAGHGQHTVSGIIAEEAFAAAADPTKFPEQLKYVTVWQAQRLFLNNSTWWDKDLPTKIANGEKNLAWLDVGGYNALLGKSYGEIAAESRTNHKSQGFGSTPTRGEQKEYLELKNGTAFSNNDIFDGISTTWERYRQGSEIKLALDKIISDFDVIHPEKSVDALLKVYTQLENTPTDQLVEFKKQQLQNIIVACLGLWLEPVAEKDMVVQGEEIKIFSSSIKRNEYPLTLESITVLNNEYKAGEILPAGINQLDTFEIRISGNLKSSPYWLDDDYNGLFTISDQKNRGKAENDPLLSFIYNVKIGEQLFNIKRAVVYKETDAVKGEIYKPLSIIPEYYIELDQNNIFLHQDAPTEISFSVYANRDLANAPLVIKSDNMDKQTSEKVFIDLKKGETRNYKVKVKPTGQLTNFGFYKIRSDSLFIFDENANERVVTTDTYFEAGSNYIIEYDHIPRQVVFEQATVKIINADIKIPQIKIAYIEGAGDKVDESLQQIGLNITTIAPEAITLNELKKYEAVVIGVRAYNTSKVLADNQSILMQYVNEGGLVITQYNTNWDMYTEIIGPYPFKIKRGRVTDENSPVDFLLPEHSVLNTPNKLTKADFDGWIQERGIYFAEELAPEYVSPLAFTDPNEKPQSGSLIIADYGKGAFMYTGIAFFRELPAGVPGAYRLFINLLSYKNQGK